MALCRNVLRARPGGKFDQAPQGPARLRPHQLPRAARQPGLLLHTAAYWLLLTVRDAIPSPQPLAAAEFTTLRMRLIKIGARITETLTRVRIAFAAACPEADLFAGLVRSFLPAGP